MELEHEKTQDLIEAYKKIKDFLTYLEKEEKNYKEQK